MPNDRLNDQRAKLLRFDLNVQRNHLFVYLLGFLVSIAGMALGVIAPRLDLAVLVLVVSCTSAATFYALFQRGADRRILNPLWMAMNIVLATIGVYATGGIDSPWFIWYVASSSAAAFASGKAAAYLVSLGNTIAYLGLLLWMGEIRWVDDAMLVALTRMIFVFGASYFFLVGVANLKEKRIRIRELEEEQSQKIVELTRLMSEVEDANRRIREADRLKSQFLANMSHELRTPMNSIIGFSEILIERLGTQISEKHLNFLRHIHESGHHLLSIINDVLDLSKIEAGKMEIYPEFFDIAPAIESVCTMMRGMTRTEPRFTVDVPAELPQIETDLAKFKQVLFNLLSNAVKFSPPGSPIAIRARFEGNSSDGWIAVSVEDQGIGVAPEHQSMIFEEFRQVDGTVRREFGGTGLGLALVKKFVELQGGRVAVASTIGAGSTFTFHLPVASRAAVVTRTPELTALPDRVLVIEDDANAFDLISAALGTAGYTAVRARHGEEALRLARESKPVAVTLDLVLPGVDGWEVLKRLKADVATRDLPVVIISMVDNRDLGMALGADDYFVKPVDRDRLIERVQAMTEGRPKAKLLLIDDDLAVHALLDEELGALGFDLASVYSGEEGLRAASERSPDVIILDLMMPGMSGFDVADSLKQNPATANIPILVLTSKEITREERHLLHSKVASFVQKGQSARDQLVREIRRVTSPIVPVPHG
ncbi:MAG TPA: response regulator [Thermoanaerobaculia bacterium]|jgi:signal transduction histidine kinase/CheY-like chemotaxis protein